MYHSLLCVKEDFVNGMQQKKMRHLRDYKFYSESFALNIILIIIISWFKLIL